MHVLASPPPPPNSLSRSCSAPEAFRVSSRRFRRLRCSSGRRTPCTSQCNGTVQRFKLCPQDRRTSELEAAVKCLGCCPWRLTTTQQCVSSPAYDVWHQFYHSVRPGCLPKACSSYPLLATAIMYVSAHELETKPDKTDPETHTLHSL